MNVALLELSPAELVHVLHLPPATLVTGCMFEPASGLVVVRVEGPGLPPCDDEDEPPRISLADAALTSRNGGVETHCGSSAQTPERSAVAGMETRPTAAARRHATATEVLP